MKKKVLVLTDHYIPSIKAGGPVQSIKNLVDNLSDQLEFYIITNDRDLGELRPFPEVQTNQWVSVGKAKVFYTDKEKLNIIKLHKIISTVDCDVIYLNSYFSLKFSIFVIILHKFKMFYNKRLIIAPRGEFSKGALSIKSVKKKLYINLSKLFGLYKSVTWHATAEIEENDIKSIYGEKALTKIANNLTSDYSGLKYDKLIVKNAGELKIVFVSRVHPKKNLIKAIDILKHINGNIQFDIYGPIEDKLYWEKCEKEIAKLPSNIVISYKGLIEHSEILDMLKKYHVFLLPTLGENFGHVISEALIGGCPVIISDQTPWRGLEKLNVGWDISLKNSEKFIKVLKRCVEMEQEEYEVISKHAFIFGKEQSNNKDDMSKAFDLFF